MRFGSYAKGLRLKQQISQYELAKEAGLTQPTIYNIENNQNVGIDSLDKLAKVYGLKLSELIAKWEVAAGKLEKRKKLQVRRRYGPRKKSSEKVKKQTREEIFRRMEQAEKDDIARKAKKKNSTIEDYDPDSFGGKQVEIIDDEGFWE